MERRRAATISGLPTTTRLGSETIGGPRKGVDRGPGTTGGDIDHATAALPDLLQQLLTLERLAHGIVGRVGEIELEARRAASACIASRPLIINGAGEGNRTLVIITKRES